MVTNSQNLPIESKAGQELIPEYYKPTIVKALARYMKGDAIIEAIRRDTGKRVTLAAVWRYKHAKKWKKLFDEERKKYVAEVYEVPCSQKVVRLERLEDLYHIARKDENYKECRDLLGSAKSEMEDKTLQNLNVTFNQYNELSDAELEEKKKRLLNRIMNIGKKEELDV